MTVCSFLTIGDNEVECFKDCVFYNCEDNGGICPFKTLTGSRAKRLKELYQYDFFGEHGLSVKEIDEYYVEKEYI